MPSLAKRLLTLKEAGDLWALLVSGATLVVSCSVPTLSDSLLVVELLTTKSSLATLHPNRGELLDCARLN